MGVAAMSEPGELTVDGMHVPINGERNLLEVIRKANVDIPTFCYHSELSIYGACRLCLVEVEGRGLLASCSTKPEPGMVVRTNTAEIRETRRTIVELLLANHPQGCLTCAKSSTCELLALARRLGIEDVPFKRALEPVPIDDSSPALIRDPNKCVLCGDCVRMCAEVQGIGAIDFAHRGADVAVQPAFGKDLGAVECVNCGQCARVCPTGAITTKSEEKEVWAALGDPETTVVAQIAPAVRVAVGEAFGLEPGADVTGKIVAALKLMGFDQVYDTCFTADLTVIEEATEFLQRKEQGERLPQFTSCCPAWIKFAEQYYPELLPNLSSCRSPQAMFGSLAKSVLPERLGVEREKLAVVSIMPCTAKKYEAKRSELAVDGIPDTDHVLTTQELVAMIRTSGLRFERLEPASFDMPFGFKTGAGVIFGNSGGVAEAVLRFAYEKVTGEKLTDVDFEAVRGEEGLREARIALAGQPVKLAVVHSLGNAREVCRQVRAGACEYDLIEVMACPGGCINGGGQPVSADPGYRNKRTTGLYNVDKCMQLHKSQDNPYVAETYATHLGDVGGHKAHELLHTAYSSKKRIVGEDLSLAGATSDATVDVRVCVGTSCFLRGSQDLLQDLLGFVESEGLSSKVTVGATFCHERCDRGPNVTINGECIERCTLAKAREALLRALPAADPVAEFSGVGDE